MSIQVRCEHCLRTFLAQDQWASRQFRCRGCGAVLLIPSPPVSLAIIVKPPPAIPPKRPQAADAPCNARNQIAASPVPTQSRPTQSRPTPPPPTQPSPWRNNVDRARRASQHAQQFARPLTRAPSATKPRSLQSTGSTLRVPHASLPSLASQPRGSAYVRRQVAGPSPLAIAALGGLVLTAVVVAGFCIWGGPKSSTTAQAPAGTPPSQPATQQPKEWTFAESAPLPGERRVGDAPAPSAPGSMGGGQSPNANSMLAAAQGQRVTFADYEIYMPQDFNADAERLGANLWGRGETLMWSRRLTAADGSRLVLGVELISLSLGDRWRSRDDLFDELLKQIPRRMNVVGFSQSKVKEEKIGGLPARSVRVRGIKDGNHFEMVIVAIWDGGTAVLAMGVGSSFMGPDDFRELEVAIRTIRRL